MSKNDTDGISVARLQKEKTQEDRALPDYCESCFLAFGSQEPRVVHQEKVVHRDCAARLRAN